MKPFGNFVRKYETEEKTEIDKEMEEIEVVEEDMFSIKKESWSWVEVVKDLWW